MPLVGKKCYDVYQNLSIVCPFCPSIEAVKTKTTQSAIVPYSKNKKPKGWLNFSFILNKYFPNLRFIPEKTLSTMHLILY